LMSLKGSA